MLKSQPFFISFSHFFEKTVDFFKNLGYNHMVKEAWARDRSVSKMQSYERKK
jgi:hypothetical protein